MSTVMQEWVEQYQGKLCPLGDNAFRFAFGLVLERTTAFLLVQQAYAHLAKKPSDYGNESDIHLVLSGVWQRFQSLKEKPAKRLKGNLSDFLASMTVEERAVLVLVDCFGMQTNEAIKLLGFTDRDFKELLKQSRYKLLQFQP